MIQRPRKRLRTHFYDALLPHEGNAYKPLLFTLGGVATVLALLFLLQAAYFVQTRFVFTETDFLASVLPGVLATLTNQDRSSAGIASLTEDAQLARAAQLKANDMAAKGYFSHVDPEGRQPWHWLQQVGYEYAYAGENLAVNFTDSEDVQEAWMRSPTHHANIVKPQYTRIGIGVAHGTYQGKETTFVVQFFATPRTTAVPQKTQLAAEAPSQGPVATTVDETDGETQVLGVEVDAVVQEEPVVDPVVETESRVQSESESPPAAVNEPVVQVAAADSAVSFFAQVAASPTHTLIYLLSALAALIAVLLLVAIAVHIKVQYLEVLGGGLLVLVVVLSLLIYNATSSPEVLIPDEAQPASAIEAL